MKSAKDILKGKNYQTFDLNKACNEIEKYFENACPHAKLVIQGAYFDDIRPDAEFYGYFMYIEDAIQEIMSSRVPLEKIGKIEYDVAIIKVESSCTRMLVDELRKNGFYCERISQGTYIVSIL